MAAGDPISGNGGDVAIPLGASLGNVGKWNLTRSANMKKYAVSGSKFKRAVAGTVDTSGSLEFQLEDSERPALTIGQRLEVELQYSATDYYTGFIVVNNVAEGIDMDNGQVDALVIGFDVDGALTASGSLAS